MPELEDRKGKKAEIEYSVHFRRMPLVRVGHKVKKGDLLTDGSADIDELFEYAGKEAAQNYIISETIKIYELQGASISRKHIEVIIKQIFSRRRITDNGDTTFSYGEVVEYAQIEEENKRVKDVGGQEAQSVPMVMGITDVSLTRRSFLSSASFQNTTRMLINAAIKGSVDRLIGLKENVIIGRLIPAGTGFAESPKAKMVARLHSSNPLPQEE